MKIHPHPGAQNHHLTLFDWFELNRQRKKTLKMKPRYVYAVDVQHSPMHCVVFYCIILYCNTSIFPCTSAHSSIRKSGRFHPHVKNGKQNSLNKWYNRRSKLMIPNGNKTVIHCSCSFFKCWLNYRCSPNKTRKISLNRLLRYTIMWFVLMGCCRHSIELIPGSGIPMGMNSGSCEVGTWKRQG